MLSESIFLRNLKAPLIVTICPTERCNLFCRHCLGSYGLQGKPDKLSLKEWTKIVDDLKSYIIKVDVTGGEPFLSNVTIPLMHHIKKEKFSVMSITTNGTLITNRIAFAMSKLRPELQFVRVSLDGAKPEVHDYIRGLGTYKLAIRGIQHLLANKIPVVVVSMIHKRTTFDDIDTMYKLAEELDFDIQYGSLFPVGEAVKFWRFLFYSPTTLNELSEYILKREKERAFKEKEIKTAIKEDEYSLEKSLRRCDVGYRGLTIMSNGMLGACYLLPLNKPYERFLSVWREDPFLGRIRDYRRDADVEICQKCKQRDFCFKTCIGTSFRVFGDFRDPSPYCILYHEYLNLDEELVKPYMEILKRIGIDID